MSEQEHLYEHEGEQSQERADYNENINSIDEWSGAEELRGDHERLELEDLDEMLGRRAARWPGHVLVAALGVSLLACLTALWFSGTLLSAPDHLLPAAFLQIIATHRLLALLVPAGCLMVCYGLLRSRTREIMAVHERYLDERQRMLRDQAHRSAFKIIKFACLLVPVGFILPHLPWFNQPAPVAPVSPFVTVWSSDVQALAFSRGAIYFQGTETHPLVQIVFQWQRNLTGPSLTIPPATTMEIIVAAGLLLLLLLLIVSALPMAVLAWKGRN